MSARRLAKLFTYPTVALFLLACTTAADAPPSGDPSGDAAGDDSTGSDTSGSSDDALGDDGDGTATPDETPSDSAPIDDDVPPETPADLGGPDDATTVDQGAAGAPGTTTDGVRTGGSGGTVDDPGSGGGSTDDGAGAVAGSTDDNTGGTGNTDDGTGGMGNTDDNTGGTGNTDDNTGGTGNTDDNTGGTAGTDDNTGGTAGTDDDCPWLCIPPAIDEVNVIVLTDAWLTNCDVEGRLYVGHDATFPSYSVGTRLEPDASRYDLVVGNDLVYDSGSVPNGAVAYGGELTRGSGAFAYGGWHNETPVDFEQLQADMLFWSESLAAQPANSQTVVSYGSIRLEGDDPDLNVFEVDASDLSGCNGLTISAPEGATILVNVSGTEVSMQNFGISFEGGASKQYTLFNMYEAETVIFSGIGVLGSVLAPHADLDFTNGNIDGQLIVDNYIVEGRASGEGHPYYFMGCPWICE